MCVDLLYVYILLWVLGEGSADDGVKEGSGDAEVSVGGQYAECLDVEVVRLLLGWWWDG